ncbi:metalloregulator ArsR/SmtB family transcription factor [Colwellia sp. MSW7]|uniref:Metalloregulator ArsR/SmtB family transcription factor n=1 Tax=Colwellia maritima TaxID=2912588 RepID=A0ABS9X0P9_9GAMM|nr:metalloregulator ArsR/SmtB family transcription factor [Colwellia maritima]MCI2283843.1 metalloregulator ArsR/SmtB family transcription factor [Colwellia maritima]
MNKNKRSVLFLCTGNSARSQIAEALLKHKAGDKFDVFSAGTHPEAIDLRAIDALEQFGVETTHLVPKSVDTFTGKTFDFVITLCDRASNECRDFPNTDKQLSWDIPDPKTRTDYMPFTTTLNELNNRLSMFLLVEHTSDVNLADSNFNKNVVTKTQKQFVTLDPVDFYKNFTDEIRLKVLMLSHYHGELCVCELMEALAEDSQPKVSRNLAVLRKSNIITARKHGQWVFYRINPQLPLWAKSVIAQTTENNIVMICKPLKRLAEMKNRPSKANFCK